MDIHEFWEVVETARSRSGPAADALVATLATKSLEQVVDFRRTFDRVTGAAHSWEVWGAAYLIGGGCSDDSFIDFKAGLVALGRDWYERAVAGPDELVAHPLVLACAEDDDEALESLFDEEFGYAAETAAEAITGDPEAFWDALGEAAGGDEDLGEGWDFDDEAQMRARLPRLSALFLG